MAMAVGCGTSVWAGRQLQLAWHCSHSSSDCKWVVSANVYLSLLRRGWRGSLLVSSRMSGTHSLGRIIQSTTSHNMQYMQDSSTLQVVQREV